MRSMAINRLTPAVAGKPRRAGLAVLAALALAGGATTTDAHADCSGIDIDRYNNSKGCYLK